MPSQPHPKTNIARKVLSFFHFFHKDRSHQKLREITQKTQSEPQIGQTGGSVIAEIPSDTAERNLTWKEWCQMWEGRH
ncbi:hypothetical protein BGW80DRAFT_243682 [Lactifluus volemus]|nr:hypothetical protein BGW80DRAFT_243682 [Lactifluus volemus]